MAVSNLVVKQDYVGNGVTTTFAIPFAYIKPEQIKVYLLDTVLGTATLQVISTNYTYNNPTNPTSIVMNVAPPAGKWLRVIRSTSIVQDTEIENNGEFLEEEMETALDKLTLMMQEVSDQMKSALILNPVDTAINRILPKISANAVLGSSPDGLSYVWRAASDFVGPTGPTGATGATGATGPTGATGATGATGYGIYFGTGAPSNGFGTDNSVYVDQNNYMLYYKVTGAWVAKGILKGPQGDAGVQGPQGIQGNTGNAGANGVDGVDGEDGSTIYSNYGPPLDAIGKDTDLYVDRNAPFNYYYKLSGTWVLQNSLQGLQGPPGVDGAIGPTAFGLFVQSGVPSNGFGNDNDIWINKDNFDLYYKVSGTWVLQGSLRPTGFNVGGTTNQVLAKNSNTDYDTKWATVDKTFVGLANVDNTSDANKPVSTAQQAALDLKASISYVDTGLGTKEPTIAPGTDGYIWTMVGGVKTWAAPPATSPLTTKGDLYTHNGTTGVRKAIGADGKILTAKASDPTGLSWEDAPISLPTQTGNNGKFLTTNGTAASWADIPAELPSQTGNTGKILETNGTTVSWVDKPQTAVSSTQTLAAAGTISRTGGRVERVKVQGTSGETSVTIAASPTPLDGDQLFIQGMSDANPIIVNQFYLTAGLIGHLMYDAAATTWRKVGGV